MLSFKRHKAAWAVTAVVGLAVTFAAAYSPEWIPLWLTLPAALVGAAPSGIIGGWASAQAALHLTRPRELFLEPAPRRTP